MKWSRKLKQARLANSIKPVIPDPPEEKEKPSDPEPVVKESEEGSDAVEEVKEIDLDDPEQNGVKIDGPEKESSDQDKE